MQLPCSNYFCFLGWFASCLFHDFFFILPGSTSVFFKNFSQACYKPGWSSKTFITTRAHTRTALDRDSRAPNNWLCWALWVVGCLDEGAGRSSIRLGDVLLDQIVPSCPDDWVRNALDEEYRSWLPLRERRAPGPCPRPQQTGRRINLESGTGHSMPGYSRSTIRTDPAVPKMSSLVPGKILQLTFLWECRSLFGKVFLSELQCWTTGVRSLWGRLSGSLWRLLQPRMSTDLWKGWRMEPRAQTAES